MTSTVAYPRGTKFVDAQGLPTQEFARNYEALLFRVNKITEAARSIPALDPGSATPATLAQALNTLLAAASET